MFFISFEGIDGSGKTTQIAKLQDHLFNNTPGVHGVTVTREPGGTEVGRLIRNILLGQDTKHVEIDHHTQVMLFAADRVAHMEQVVKPALARGEWVLCDRWQDSTSAYQGAGNKLTDSAADRDYLDTVAKLAARGVQPSTTILLDIPVETSVARISARGDAKDRFEDQEIEFRQRVRDEYLWLARVHPQRIKVIDATQTPDAVFAHVLDALAYNLKLQHIEHFKHP